MSAGRMMRDASPGSGTSQRHWRGREAQTGESKAVSAGFKGRRVAVVHYGEGAELDPGHRRHRCGQLAASLVEHGAEVVRIVPSFRQWDGGQRPQSWTGTEGAEGRLVVIPTRSFENTRGRDRAGSLRDFNRGVAGYFAESPPFDLVVCGFPPPGLIRRVAENARGAAIIADIRDLWPDALVPNGSLGDALQPVASVVGHALARELRLADAVVAMSPTMLERSPRGIERTAVIPLGFEPPAADQRLLWPAADDPFTALFVGSMTQLFDLRSMLLGWQQFVRGRSAAGRSMPRLVVVGDGEQRSLVDELVGGDETVTCTGWVLGHEVVEHLQRADIGLAPTRPGQGTTISNKVAEYLSSGLYVVNTLTELVAAELDDAGLGMRVDSVAVAWSEGFEAAERNVDSLRAGRGDRQVVAGERYGKQRSEQLWFGVIADVLDARRSTARLVEAPST